jgi:excisionase family DNA binding protein
LKAELTLPPELVEEIADKVTERLKPILASNGKHEAEDRLLTPDDLARLLKVKKPQIYAWVYESKYSDDGIPFYKAGKFLRFSEKAILEWMRKHDR